MDFWGFGVKKNPGLIPWKLTWTLRMGSWKIWKWYFSIGISNYIGGSSIFRCHTSSFRGEQMGPPGSPGGFGGPPGVKVWKNRIPRRINERGWFNASQSTGDRITTKPHEKLTVWSQTFGGGVELTSDNWCPTFSMSQEVRINRL